MREPLASIVVVALNEEDTIGDCLDAVERLDYPKERLEVILVDGGSTDKTRTIAGKHKVRILSGGNIPSSRNLGLKESLGEVIGFVDADCIMPKDWLKKALKHFKDGNTACVGAKYTAPKNAPTITKAMLIQEKKTDWIPTRGCLFRKDALEAIGGFDETLDTGEDMDAGLRLTAKGYVIIKDPTLSFYHAGYPKNCREYFKKRIWWSKNLMKIWAKHGFFKRMLPNAAYALMYLCWMALLPPAALMSIIQQNPAPLALTIFLPAIPSVLLAASTSLKSRKPEYMPALTLMYLLWGAADAVSIVKYNQLKYLIRK